MKYYLQIRHTCHAAILSIGVSIAETRRNRILPTQIRRAHTANPVTWLAVFPNFFFKTDMRFFTFLVLLGYLLYSTNTLRAQCPADYDSIRIEVNPDYAFEEASWKIYEKSNPNLIYASGILLADSLHIFEACIPRGDCKVLEFLDDQGDGFFPDGWYRFYINGELIRESIGYYGYFQRTDFGCPPGTNCNSPLPLTLGSFQTPDGDETWYEFTPADTGIYVISTCGAPCRAKVWGYNQCNGIIISENVMGAVFYSESGCPDSSALASVFMAGGETYLIRIRYAVAGCSPDPLPFTVTFQGPIVGCMDPIACNYEPLATISSGNCLYNGDPLCPNAPDITIDQNLLISSMYLGDQQSDDACYVSEGCLRGFGNRHVIKFDTRISNIGNADYYVGPKPTDPNDPSNHFIYDPCHGHYHYLGYAEYVLYNSAGKRIPIGSKNGFCVLDAECPLGITAKYKCTNMGITAGCSDVYDAANTLCQWVDITDIPADDYILVARVNWNQRPDKLGRVEKTYDNNWAQACFSLFYDGATPEVIFNQDSCKSYTDCTGVVFGSAEPDCNGVCNGPALHGDLNQDTLQSMIDVNSYLADALNPAIDASPCNDLYEDGKIDVMDAGLLQECALHADSIQYWIQRFPCQFPSGIYNSQDMVTLLAGVLDTVDKTFDIEIVNPSSGVMGYEFTVDGLVIESVENTIGSYQATPQFNPVTGKILALAPDESYIPKNVTPNTFVRIKYANINQSEVCISGITAVVNQKYHKSNAVIGTPACVPTNMVGAKEPATAFAVFVQPNPMQESSTIYFENPAAEAMQFQLTDMLGQVVRSYQDIRGESVVVERGDLPHGAYAFTLLSQRGSVSGKIIMQ